MGLTPGHKFFWFGQFCVVWWLKRNAGLRYPRFGDISPKFTKFKGFLATLGHWRGSKGAHAMPIQTYLWENRFKSIGLGSVACLVVKTAMRRARESIKPQIISVNFLEVLPMDLS